MTIRSAPPHCDPLRAPLSLLTPVPRACTAGPCRVLGPSLRILNSRRVDGSEHPRELQLQCTAMNVLAATAAAPRAARHRAPLRWKRARCPAPSSPEPPFQTASALSIRTAAQPPTQIGYPDSLGVRYRTRPAYPDSLSASPIPSPSQLTSIPPPMCVRSLIALVLSIRILIHSNGGPAAYPGRLSR